MSAAAAGIALFRCQGFRVEGSGRRGLGCQRLMRRVAVKHLGGDRAATTSPKSGMFSDAAADSFKGMELLPHLAKAS